MNLDAKKLPFGVRISDDMAGAIELGAVIDAAIDDNRRKVLRAMWDEMNRRMVSWADVTFLPPLEADTPTVVPAEGQE